MKTSPYRYHLHASGRCGTISCSKDDLDLQINWEISGVTDKAILLAPIDLTHWASGLEISREEQRLILRDLRDWLSEKKTKTDLDRPTDEVDHSTKCSWNDCRESPLMRSAYCGMHYDDTLLAK